MTEPYYADDHIILYHGDCLEILEWLSADVLVTDPPYGYSHSSNKEGKYCGEVIANDRDTSTRDSVVALWRDRSALIFGSWKMPKPVGTHTVLIWDKGMHVGMGDLSIPWKPNTEEIYVLGRGFHGHRGSSIISAVMVSWESKGRQHPNMKPTALLEALLVKCPPGMVADPFAGSGSTLVAAKALGRRAIGVEIEERYCEIAANRLAQDVLDFELPA